MFQTANQSINQSFDRPYTISCWCSLATMSLSCTVNEISICQMAPLEQGIAHPITAHYLFIDLERMKGCVAFLSAATPVGINKI